MYRWPMTVAILSDEHQQAANPLHHSLSCYKLTRYPVQLAFPGKEELQRIDPVILTGL